MGTIPKSQECFSIFNRDLLYNKQKLRIKNSLQTGIDLESDSQPIDIIAVPHLVVTIRIPKSLISAIL